MEFILEFLKDAFEALEQRVRSPFLGSIAISFFVINWKPLWYLFFADRPVAFKLDYFELKTDPNSLIWYPLFFGVALALLTPFLRLVGAWWAKWPTFKLKTLQKDQANDLLIHEENKKEELEKSRSRAEDARAVRIAKKEQEKIDAALRKKEAAKLGDDVSLKVEEVRRNAIPINEVSNELGDIELAESLLKAAAESEDGFAKIMGLVVTHHHPINGLRDVFTLETHRNRMEAEYIISQLDELGLVRDTEENGFSITSRGYDYLDLPN